ncbi:MAG: NADH-quinone oxidoreductase subunit N [Desulfobacterales bacterium]|jgi:NADH-quinone oxidoreductase subunit N
MTPWILFGPEIVFLLTALGFLCVSMTRLRDGIAFWALVLAAIGVAACVAGAGLEGELFYGTYRIDLFSQVFKALLAMGLFLVVCLCPNLQGVASERHPELFALLFTCTLAMMLLVSSVHLLTMYVALELSSYSLYILVAMRDQRARTIEASLKYFLTGVVASAVMVFGLALLYSVTQAVFVDELVRVLPAAVTDPVVAIGLLLTLCGFFFKLAVFPFHIWAPDVYQGAANQVSAYIATASKVAAVAILTRIVALTGNGSPYLVHALVALSIVSMTVGNLSAIAQKDIKRLFAYSSIAHAGYVLIGILSMSASGYAAAVFYAMAVLVMKFTCFLVVVKVADNGENLDIGQLAGLHHRSPVLAMALMISVFGLAGIPPTVGFTGKLLLFTAAMENGYLTLILIAMANVVISLYYYLLVVKAAYLAEPELPQGSLSVSLPERILAGSLVAFMVVAGIYPSWFIDLAREAVRSLG